MNALFAVIYLKNRPACGVVLSLVGVSRSPETLPRHGDQPFAVEVEVHQGEGRQQPFVILLQAPVSHLGKSEHPLRRVMRNVYHIITSDSGTEKARDECRSRARIAVAQRKRWAKSRRAARKPLVR